jgi:hypothetical protein
MQAVELGAVWMRRGVYGYVLMTEPPDEARMAAIGCKSRQGSTTAPTSSLLPALARSPDPVRRR